MSGRDTALIKVILWDVDNTLLDFHAAEYAAVKALFREMELGECTDEMVVRYSAINDSFWKRLERGELTRPEVLTGRFRQFFSESGVDPEKAVPFNEKYQLRLGDTIVFRDDSLNIVKSLKNRVKQYAVSNGTIIAQTKKLGLSGLGELMDGIFLSEELGVEKPNKAFFDSVLKDISSDADDPAVRKLLRSEVMIVGDSLTSDIRGGMNAGILTCWYNPKHQPVPDGYSIDWIIADLHEIYGLL